jgi:hypothetical protein
VPFPIRFNPVFVSVQVLQIGTKTFVDGYESATVDSYADPITVRGQPNFKRRQWDRLQRGFSGDVGDTVGSLICRASDLAEDGWEPKKGDRLVSIAEREANFVVEEVRYESPTPPLAAGAMATRHEIVYIELSRDDRRRQTEQR